MGSSPIFRIIQKKVLTDVKSLGIISVIARKSISTKCDMRKCRNWQTSKTKDLVTVRSCGFKSHLPHAEPLMIQGLFFLPVQGFLFYVHISNCVCECRKNLSACFF